MNEIYITVIKLCETFLLAELICALFPSDRSLRFSINLITVFLFISIVSNISALNFDFNLNISESVSEYREDAENLYLSETEKLLTKRIEASLNSVYIECENLTPYLKIDESGEVYLDSLEVNLKYKSDIERAKAVIRELFKNSKSYKIEVKADG